MFQIKCADCECYPKDCKDSNSPQLCLNLLIERMLPLLDISIDYEGQFPQLKSKFEE